MKKIVVAFVIIGIVLGILMAGGTYKKVSEKLHERGWKGKEIALQYSSNVIFVTVNLFLLLALLVIYFNNYMKTKSAFMLGLVFFIGVLIIQTILSLPFIRIIFGYPYFFPLPHFFETLALVILLILSLE